MNERENLMRKVLTSEVKFVLSILVFFFGVVSPYFSMKQDIALIQKDINTITMNHSKHIEDAYQQLQQMNVKIEEHARAITILLERLPRQ